MPAESVQNWYRFDVNDGWRRVPPCEAAAMMVDRICPVALCNPGRKVGERLWKQMGCDGVREAVRLKLLERFRAQGKK